MTITHVLLRTPRRGVSCRGMTSVYDIIARHRTWEVGRLDRIDVIVVLLIDGMVGELRVVGSVPAREKYLYEQYVVDNGLTVRVSIFIIINDIGLIFCKGNVLIYIISFLVTNSSS